METPLSPLDFARRARRLYADREAVVDGERRFTYREFFERCDRWSAALQQLRVKPGERVVLHPGQSIADGVAVRIRTSTPNRE